MQEFRLVQDVRLITLSTDEKWDHFAVLGSHRALVIRICNLILILTWLRCVYGCCSALFGSELASNVWQLWQQKVRLVVSASLRVRRKELRTVVSQFLRPASYWPRETRNEHDLGVNARWMLHQNNEQPTDTSYEEAEEYVLRCRRQQSDHARALDQKKIFSVLELVSSWGRTRSSQYSTCREWLGRRCVRVREDHQDRRPQ